MTTLFIDTHLFDIRILLLKENNIIVEEKIANQRHNSVYLLQSIEKITENINYNQIVVVNGPGSFTGVRIGVTVAKTLAYTQNIPIKMISYLDMMAYSSEKKDCYFAFSDNNGFFIGHYNNKKLKEDYFYLSTDEYNGFCQNHDVVTEVIININDIMSNLENVDYISPHLVNPIYVKLISVENDKKS